MGADGSLRFSYVAKGGKRGRCAWSTARRATVLAAVSVAVLGDRARTRTARQRVAAQAAKEVSVYLGNTPAVCRESYIDPRVFERFYDGETIELDLDALAEPPLGTGLAPAERAVLGLLAR